MDSKSILFEITAIFENILHNLVHAVENYVIAQQLIVLKFQIATDSKHTFMYFI